MGPEGQSDQGSGSVRAFRPGRRRAVHPRGSGRPGGVGRDRRAVREVAGGSLLGQVVPPQAGTLETRTKVGMTTSPVDEGGFFTVEPIPPGPFLLRFRTADGACVMTGWITL